MSDTNVSVAVSNPAAGGGAPAIPAAPEPPPADSGKSSRIMLYGAITASFLILAGYVTVTVLLFFFEVPEKSQNMATMMFNTLQTLAVLAAGYWLGSSSSSAQRAASQTATPAATSKSTA